jgi:hypothetical protein
LFAEDLTSKEAARRIEELKREIALANSFKGVRDVQPENRYRLEHPEGPGDWVSGDEPMTGAQASYLKTLCEQAHRSHDFHEHLTKAEASKMTDKMRPKAGVA